MDGFRNRAHAGEALGRELLQHLPSEEERRSALVLGLVRGGLPVAAPVARILGAQLDAFVSRKIGAPLHPEYGIGAIAEGGEFIIHQEAAGAVGATGAQLDLIVAREAAELQRRVQLYRQGRDVAVAGRVVVLVDDGLATGVTARAALQALRAQGAARLLLAVPVGSGHTVRELQAAGLADKVVCLMTPSHFRAVGQWYDDFSQTTDEEVIEILGAHPQPTAGPATPAAAKQEQVKDAAPAGSRDTAAARDQVQTAARLAAPQPAVETPAASSSRPAMQPTAGDQEVTITHRAAAGVQLHGTLTVPPAARGVILFAHGSGSSRHSPRNRQVAATLHNAGFATLLFDLLSAAEAEQRSNVFDIPLLASRLELAVDWLQESNRLPAAFPVGFFGASTGGGAALSAAATLRSRGVKVQAVVVRGGRPDLATEQLPAVAAHTLLLVGSADSRVLELNEAALSVLGSRADSALKVVPQAGHLFEGPGQLEQVAQHAADWFRQHMAAAAGEP